MFKDENSDNFLKTQHRKKCCTNFGRSWPNIYQSFVRFFDFMKMARFSSNILAQFNCFENLHNLSKFLFIRSFYSKISPVKFEQLFHEWNWTIFPPIPVHSQQFFFSFRPSLFAPGVNSRLQSNSQKVGHIDNVCNGMNQQTQESALKTFEHEKKKNDKFSVYRTCVQVSARSWFYHLLIQGWDLKIRSAEEEEEKDVVSQSRPLVGIFLERVRHNPRARSSTFFREK